MRGRVNYGAKRTRGFPSKLEAAVYDMLVLKHGKENVLRQQPIVLQGGKRVTRITWKVDFKVLTGESFYYVEAKGFPTDVYKLKLKLYRGLDPRPAPLEIWGGSSKRLVLMERLE